MFHLILHFLIPALLVSLFYRKKWQFAYFIMIATMIVDIDHLLATPIYDPQRCSIGFHPLHTFIPIILYGAMIFYKRTHFAGLGLICHMVLDSIDCYVNTGQWYV